MITEPRVFLDGYLPDVQHRGSEMEVLTDAVAPILDGDRGHDVLLHGPQGVGKTVLARAALDCLNRERPTQYAHVHSLGSTPTGIIREILTDLPGHDPAKTTSKDRLIEMLQDRCDEPTVAVLDEGDDLPEGDVFDTLRSVPNLSWIAICHDHEDWLSRVDDATRHAVTNWTLGLDRYSTAELTDILDERSRMGLERGVIQRGQLERIADEAAGVARPAIYSLRAAARLAEERGHETIEPVDVDDSFARARRELREQALQSLPFQHHVLYEIIRRRGEIDARTLHDRYEAVKDAVYADVPQTELSKRSRRNKLQKLDAYDLIECGGPDHNPIYSVCDASIPSPLDLDVPVP